MSFTEIENEALRLTEQERALLAERLLSSLSETTPDQPEEVWLEEAERRYNEYKAGRMSACSAEDVFRDAHRTLFC